MSRALPFTLLDRYTVEAEIGRGGNAVVYRAQDVVLERMVAIKLIREEVSSPTTVSRFHQEVQVTAKLEHANILHVYDTGSFEGRPFVVMELATGTSLGARLAVEPQLPVADALSIARDVGLALAHAHANNVIHRDVKPENILVTESGAFLADFGIARVMQERVVDQLTSTGMAVGTVLYMSPEQLCADRSIDGRSDQYSLACVLYEMLAGVRPHIAASVEGLRVLRTMGQQPPVRTHRPSVPAIVEEALAVAMSPIPADRYRTVDDFVRRLESGMSSEWRGHSATDAVHTRTHGSPDNDSGAAPWRASERSTDGGHTPPARRQRSTVVRWLVGASVATATIAAVAMMLTQRRDGGVVSTTTGRAIAVVTTRAQLLTQRDRDLVAALEAEFRSWDGVRVVPVIATGDTLGLTISPSVTWLGDSARVVVTVGEGQSPLRRELTRFVAVGSLTTGGRAISGLAREALGGDAVQYAEGVESLPDRSLKALRAYVHAFTEMRAGRLDSAASAFRDAASHSPGFSHADYWAAQVAAWQSPRAVEEWKQEADRAARSGTLRGVDSLFAVALSAMAGLDFPRACALYDRIAGAEPNAFVAWYGRGECARLDTVVVRDRGEWQFRSSEWSALRAYREAVRHAPTSALLVALYPRIWNTTYAAGSRVRNGRANDAAKTEFTASPALQADTLALNPIPRAEVNAMGARAVPPTWYAAVRRGREAAVELTKLWIDRFPDSPHAWFQHAISLEVAGRVKGLAAEQSVVEALRRAALGSQTPLDSARIAIVGTRLWLRLGDVEKATTTARAALSSIRHDEPSVRQVLAPLAAFVGDDSLTVLLSDLERLRIPKIPAILSDSLSAFQLYAVLGKCNGLSARQDTLERLFRTRFSDNELEPQRRALLRAPYRDAVPCLGPSVTQGFVPTNPLEEVYASLAGGDSARARRILNALPARRGGATMAAFTWDYLFAEAWARRASGDAQGTRALLLTALEDIENMSMSTLEEVPQAAGFRRALQMLEAWSAADALATPLSTWAAKAAFLTKPDAGGIAK